MRLHLINPFNPLVSMSHAKQSRWQRYRVWKPLGLLTLAGLTPPGWQVTVFDENLGVSDYASLPAPDLVGVTAFTSQANRAYEVAAEFRSRGVPVVMGGIHATVCPDEALQHVDSVVTGEAESVWASVLEDARHGRLARTYAGDYADMGQYPPARHDLLTKGYAFGAIQTTRGCPLNCSFCSVSAMNGKRYRHRPIDDVIREMRTVREKLVLIVDDNLIGIGAVHVERAKELMRAMIRAKLRKKWICQVTINMADDEELLALAAKAGCKGVFIGFESPTNEGLAEVGKEFNVSKGRDLRASVRRIQRHKIGVMGSFIMGLDTDTPGIGRCIADAASDYGVDMLNVLFLTPLPGTRLWDSMHADGRIAADTLPEDWKYFTLNFPVARYKHLSWADILREMDACNRRFYSSGRIGRRLWQALSRRRAPLFSLVSNLCYRAGLRTDRLLWRELDMRRGPACEVRRSSDSQEQSRTPAKEPVPS